MGNACLRSEKQPTTSTTAQYQAIWHLVRPDKRVNHCATSKNKSTTTYRNRVLTDCIKTGYDLECFAHRWSQTLQRWYECQMCGSGNCGNNLSYQLDDITPPDYDHFDAQRRDLTQPVNANTTVASQRYTLNNTTTSTVDSLKRQRRKWTSRYGVYSAVLLNAVPQFYLELVNLITDYSDFRAPNAIYRWQSICPHRALCTLSDYLSCNDVVETHYLIVREVSRASASSTNPKSIVYYVCDMRSAAANPTANVMQLDLHSPSSSV
jgi:hypothetical protein